MKSLLVCLMVFSTIGCSTSSKSRLAVTAIGFGSGAVIGAATAPKDEHEGMHAVYWGSILGLVTAVASNYYYNDEKNRELLELENQKLKAQLDVFQSGTVKELVTNRVREQSTVTGEKKKFNIKIYKVDKWIDQDEHTKIHADQIMEITPVQK